MFVFTPEDSGNQHNQCDISNFAHMIDHHADPHLGSAPASMRDLAIKSRCLGCSICIAQCKGLSPWLFNKSTSAPSCSRINSKTVGEVLRTLWAAQRRRDTWVMRVKIRSESWRWEKLTHNARQCYPTVRHWSLCPSMSVGWSRLGGIDTKRIPRRKEIKPNKANKKGEGMKLTPSLKLISYPPVLSNS